jgi:hypothetical protein
MWMSVRLVGVGVDLEGDESKAPLHGSQMMMMMMRWHKLKKK